MDPDAFNAAYPVTDEHRQWAAELLADPRIIEAQRRAAPPRPYDGKDYDALGEEVLHG